MRQVADVHEDRHDSREDVDDAHHRHHDGGDLHDAAAAAEDAVRHEHRLKRAEDPRRGGRVIEAVRRESGLEIVRAEHIEAPRVGEDEEDGEDARQEPVVERALDVVRRAAVREAQFRPALEDLSQMNAVEPPMRAMAHIQKTAPGPPRQIAVEMPMMLPVPTRDAVETISAWKDDTSPPSGFSRSTRKHSGKRRICIRPVLTVKYSPAATSTTTNIG